MKLVGAGKQCQYFKANTVINGIGWRALISSLAGLGWPKLLELKENPILEEQKPFHPPLQFRHRQILFNFRVKNSSAVVSVLDIKYIKAGNGE